MRTLAYFVIPDRRLVASTSGANFVFPRLAAGQTLALGLRFLDRINGTLVEVERGVRSLRATIGTPDARPLSGRTKLKLGGAAPSGANTSTVFVDWNASQASFAAALNTIADRTADFTVRTIPGGWVVRCGAGVAFDLHATQNELAPVSFLRVRGYDEPDGTRSYEVRFTQAPLAFTDSNLRGDPPEPTIETIADGYTDGSGSYFSNEVQKLVVPVDFRAGYFLRDPRTMRRTVLLTIESDADAIGEALQAILAEGETVTVEDITTTGSAEARLTFGGAIAGVDLDPFEVMVAPDAPPGDVEIVLPLTRPELFAALREGKDLTGVPLEISLDLLPTVAAEEDVDAPVRRVTSAGIVVTITPPIAWDGLAVVTPPAWLRPPSAPGYLPSDPSNVGVGQLVASFVLGDGATTEFVVDHELGEQSLTGFVVIDRTTGRLRRDGFEAFMTSADALTIIFDEAPTEALEGGGGVEVLVATPQTLEVFLAGLAIDIEQVNGLRDELDDLHADVAALQAVLPQTGPGTSAAGGDALRVTFPDRFALVPRAQDARVQAVLAGLEITGEGDDAKVPLISPAALPRPGWLLGAIHDPVVTSHEAGTPLPDPATQLRQVRALSGGLGATQEVAIGGGYRTAVLSVSDNDGFVGSDGRAWYPVRKGAVSPFLDATRSYYPRDLERTHFELAISQAQFRVGAELTLEFRVALQLIAANTAARAELVIEIGVVERESSSGNPQFGANISGINYYARPLAQEVVITADLVTHRCGLRIKRSASGLVTDKLLYGTWIGGAPSPETPDFVLRGRLINFDTGVLPSNPFISVPDARGYLYSAFYGATAKISA